MAFRAEGWSRWITFIEHPKGWFSFKNSCTSHQWKAVLWESLEFALKLKFSYISGWKSASAESSRSFAIDLAGDEVLPNMAGEGGSSRPFFLQTLRMWRGQNKSAPRPFPGLLSSVKIALPLFIFPVLRALWVSGGGNAAGFSIARSLWPELCSSRELPSPPCPAAHCCWWELSSCLFWGKGLGFGTPWMF